MKDRISEIRARCEAALKAQNMKREMRKTVREDCKYWEHSCKLCGITGNDYCPCKCEDYEADSYNPYDEEW